MIEGDDDNTLSWQEFESFFMSAGWSATGSVRGSTTSLLSPTDKGDGSGLVYVIERCQSELQEEYKELLRTGAGQGVIHRLEPGVSYRFRVYAVNVDGVSGPPSPSIVVHSLIEVLSRRIYCEP
jgi:hypothetical protein